MSSLHQDEYLTVVFFSDFYHIFSASLSWVARIESPNRFFLLSVLSRWPVTTNFQPHGQAF